MTPVQQWLLLFSCALFVTISGCQTAPVDKPVAAGEAAILWEQHNTTMAALQRWNVKGKMAVRSGKHGDSASLIWRVEGESAEIELYGPFGGGRVRIAAQPGEAILRDTRGNVDSGETVAEVLDRRLGWQIPFDEMALWIRGIVGPQAQDIRVDTSGRLQSFQQDNWLVGYTQHQQIDEYWLPRKMNISAVPGTMEIYDDEGRYLGDELSVRIVLKRWWDLELD